MQTPLEQQARDIMERCGCTSAQQLSASEVCELANILSERAQLIQLLNDLRWHRSGGMVSPGKWVCVECRHERTSPERHHLSCTIGQWVKSA